MEIEILIDELEERLVVVKPDDTKFTARTGLSIRPFMKKIIVGLPDFCCDCPDRFGNCTLDIMDEKQKCLDELEAEQTRSKELESTIVLLESRIRELERRST